MSSVEFFWLAVIVASFGHRMSCEKEEMFGKFANMSGDSKSAINEYQQNQQKMLNYNKLYAATHFRGHMGCTELRSKRFISDGQCTSPRPIFDIICADWCLKPATLSAVNSSSHISYATQINFDSNHRQSGIHKKTLMEKWRCTNGLTKRRKVKLLCRDGSRRIYHVRVISECNCLKQDQPVEKSKRFINAMERIQKLT